MTITIKYIRLLVIFFLLSSSVYADDAIDRYSPTAFCKEDPWDQSCIQRIEQAWLREIGNKVKRVKNQLILRLQNGSTIIRKDSPKDFEGFWESKGKPNVKYWLYAYLGKAGFYVLYLGYWEGTGYEFISEKDGRSVIVHGSINFSPDRSMVFVTLSADIDKTAGLEIWSTRSGRISKNWSYTTENWPLVASLWISNNEIHLHELKWENGRPIYRRKLGVLRLSSEGWTRKEWTTQQGGP